MRRDIPPPPNLLKLAQMRLRKERASPGAHMGAQGPAELGQAERVHVPPPQAPPSTSLQCLLILEKAVKPSNSRGI